MSKPRHRPVGAYLPVGQLDGDCACGQGAYPCPDTEDPGRFPPLLAGDDEHTKMGRPTYPQTHPAMANARNIVNQILDEARTDIDTRQRINDDCDQFVAWMLEQYAAIPWGDA